MEPLASLAAGLTGLRIGSAGEALTHMFHLLQYSWRLVGSKCSSSKLTQLALTRGHGRHAQEGPPKKDIRKVT